MATMTPNLAPAPPPSDFDGGRPMTIMEHLTELRGRLIWCCVGLVIALGISLYFGNQFLEVLTRPFNEQAPPGAHLVVQDPLENFTTYFKVSLYAAIGIAMPVFVYQTLMFVLPGLTPQEKRWVLPVVGGIFLCFMVGVLFAYFVTLPAGAGFLLNFNKDVATPLINLNRWISFCTRLLFWVGISFETPLFILALSRFGIITGRQLLGWWRYVIVLVFVIAAIITPTPDPLNQTLVAVPILLLYFLGVLLAFFFGRKTAGRGRMLKRLRREQ